MSGGVGLSAPTPNLLRDVDLRDEDVVRVHRAADPDKPTIYRPGRMAEAEHAAPGWTIPVDDLFE
jgi:hypothetical protein